MTRVIVTLYDHPDKAHQVMRDLHDAGFDSTQVESIETDPKNKNLRTRVFSIDAEREPWEVAEASQVLSDMGIADDEVAHYAEGVRRGNSLVVVKSDAELAGRARQIMKRYPAIEDVERTTHQGYYP